MPETVIDDEPLQATRWFDPSSSPTREGVYERLDADGRFSCWNGSAWNAGAATVADAAAEARPSARQAAAWRGLVEPHGAPCATCGGHTVVDRGTDEDTGADLIAECPDC